MGTEPEDFPVRNGTENCTNGHWAAIPPLNPRKIWRASGRLQGRVEHAIEEKVDRGVDRSPTAAGSWEGRRSPHRVADACSLLGPDHYLVRSIHRHIPPNPADTDRKSINYQIS